MDNFWQSCLDRFKSELSAQQFNTWIKPLRIEQGDEGFNIVAPSPFVLLWVKDRFLPSIVRWSQEYFGEEIPFELTAKGNPAAKTSSSTAPPAIPSRQVQDEAKIRREHSRLNPAFTFDTFVTGKANQLARAAAIQIGENPGLAYNPLFIYGGVGLGKTHLIQAIGNLVQSRNPEARIRYTHAEQYVSDVVKAYRHKAFDDFKQFYHSLDLLLIDDIQFFSGKARTQEEFFYAFNALVDSKRQVIITCDTYPKEIAGVEDRLISRFGWGLTVAIEPPELEMRVAILLRKSEMENMNIDESVAFFIAKHIRSNIRELEGALKRVFAYSRFTGNPVSLDLAKEALKDLIAVQNRQVSIENIQKTVADYYKIKVADMYSKKRTRVLARPRQMAMALTKELTQMSLPDIGEAFGGRDHTTVLHACRKIAELRSSSPDISREFNTLLQILRN